MNRFIALLAATALVAPTMAQAVTPTPVQQSVPVSGNVASLCVLGSPNPSSVDVGQMAQTSGGSVGQITSISTQNVTLPSSFCNYAGTQITVQGTALVAADPSAVQTGFTRAVNFTSTVTTWGATPAAVTTAADETGLNSGVTQTASGGTLCSPKLTDLNLALSGFATPGSNLLLVAGGYSGTVTITLGPSVGGCGT